MLLETVFQDNNASGNAPAGALSKVAILGSHMFTGKLVEDYIRRTLHLECMFFTELDLLIQNMDQNHQPYILLIECSGYDILSTVESCLQKSGDRSGLPCIALLNFDQKTGCEQKTKLIDIGVRGIFYTSDSPEVLTQGIRELQNGKLWLTRDVMISFIENRRLIKNNNNNNGNHKLENSSLCLTNREIEILLKITKGASNQDIADGFCLSIHTVKTHLHNIFKKIDVTNRMQASLWALSNLDSSA